MTQQIGGHRARAAVSATFTIALERQFGEPVSPNEITQFVSDIRSVYPNGHKVDPILAESLIRHALGDDSALQGVDLTDAPATEMFISIAVVDHLQLNEEQLNEFVSEAREFALEELGEVSS